MFVKWKAMKSIKWVNYLLITTLVASVTFAPIARGLSTVDERGSRKLFGGYRITPKFCRASKTLPPSDPRSKGPTICMFNHECAQRNGEVVGACMDGFLFGACCQIPGVIENSLLQQVQTPQITSNSAAALSYENYGTQLSSNELKDPLLSNYNSNPEETDYQNPTGTFYDSSGSELENDSNQGNNVPSSNAVPEDQKTNQFYVNHDSVIISSPSSLHFQSVSSTPSTIETSNPAGNYSSEVPTQISTQQYIVSNYEEETHISKPTQSTSTVHKTPNIIEIENEEFSHSDITHPAAESELIEDDLQFSTGYGPSTSYVPSPTQQTASSSIQTGSSAQEQIFSHQKPEFKPKPTAQTPLLQTNDGNYVLIQTLSNDKSDIKPPLEGITTGDIESIESIILMLNSSNHGPAYNIDNPSPDPNRVVYTPVSTNKAPISVNSVASDKYGTGSFYITTVPSTISSTNTRKPVITAHPTFSSESNGYENLIAISSNSSTASFSQNHIASSAWPPTPIFSSTNRPSTIFFSSSTTRKPKPPLKPAKPAQNNEIIITPTRRRPTPQPTKIRQPPLYSYVVIPTKPVPSFIIKKPIPAYTLSGTKTPKPISTSYVTGSTTFRPKPSSFPSFSGSTTSGISLNKIQEQSYSTTSNIPYTPSYGSSPIIPTKTVSLSPVTSPRPQKPSYVKIPATQRPPSPTVIITPKPAVNIPTASPWTKLPTATPPTTTINSKFPTNSHVISSVISTSERPDLSSSTQTYLNVPTVVSNDFDDPGYFANEVISTKPPFYNQLTTDTLFTLRPSDDRPAFPGYYGPTPSYGAFDVPTASELDQIPEEETHTSPNDFVNFPPVRNPNLNMSATSSAVTYDLDMSTPAFVEDDILKDKMNLLVNKIVQSLQGNFNVLADIIEERNNSIPQTNVDRTTLRPPGATTKRSAVTTRLPSQPTRTPTKRPIVTNRPPGPNRATTQRPLGPNRVTTQRPSGTRKPTIATKKPLSTKKPATKPSSAVTKKPATTIATRRPTKPTRKVPTTTELQDEEENQDNSVEDNEIETEEDSEGSRRFQCGVRPHVKSGRIVGGKGATFGEYPWQVLVRESTWLGLFTKNKCGGVLITNKYVVTAAHCQPGFLASLVTVFGEFDISGDLETKRSVTKNVKRVIVHRQYDAATFENDLALLELESPIHYDSHIVPICMPPDTADFTGRMATVTGWGRLKYGGGVPSILQEVQVPIIENSVCQEMFHTAGHKKKILPSFLCAGYANGQKDSCEGDSGGPLVLQREDGHWELAGTVSHGIKCAAPYLPGVYMRTTYYKPWLKSITGIK